MGLGLEEKSRLSGPWGQGPHQGQESGGELWEGLVEEVGLENWEVQAGSERRRDGIPGGEGSVSEVGRSGNMDIFVCKGAEDQVGANFKALKPRPSAQACAPRWWGRRGQVRASSGRQGPC